ncbi:1519_t:CDS:2, partial [Entrophospora sp. SA101]
MSSDLKKKQILLHRPRKINAKRQRRTLVIQHHQIDPKLDYDHDNDDNDNNNNSSKMIIDDNNNQKDDDGEKDDVVEEQNEHDEDDDNGSEILLPSNNNNDVDFTDTVTSPTGSISSSSNITFVTKQIRKKPYIPRPPNSFILYRQHHHPLILNKNPGINNSEISRIIADHWRRLSDKEKDEWKRKAEEAKERHMKAWPDYKYQPRRRVVGPTFKKPLKGPGGINNNDEDLSKSVVIIAGGSKALALRNNNNKPSPSDMLNAKFA